VSPAQFHTPDHPGAAASSLVIPAKGSVARRASALAVKDRSPLVIITPDQGRSARLQIQCQSYSADLAAAAAAAGAEGLPGPLPQAICTAATTWAAAAAGGAGAGGRGAAPSSCHALRRWFIHVGAEGSRAPGGYHSSCCGFNLWRQRRPTCATGAAWGAGHSTSDEHLSDDVLPLNHGADLCLNVCTHVLNGQDACREWKQAGRETVPVSHR
jgi:hypothetical protein